MELLKKMHFKIKRKICSKNGHKWYYLFTSSDALNSNQKVRTCKRCNKTQIIKKYSEDFLCNKIVENWSTMIGCTKKGEKKKFKPEHLKN